MAMAKNEFYSLKLKKKITIPPAKQKIVIKNNRRFAVGTYKVDGVEQKAWKVLGMK